MEAGEEEEEDFMLPLSSSGFDAFEDLKELSPPIKEKVKNALDKVVAVVNPGLTGKSMCVSVCVCVDVSLCAVLLSVL